MALVFRGIATVVRNEISILLERVIISRYIRVDEYILIVMYTYNNDFNTIGKLYIIIQIIETY